MKSNLWHLRKNGEQSGPYTTPDLARLIITGNALPKDEIYQEGSQEWLCISESTFFSKEFIQKAQNLQDHRSANLSDDILLNLLGLYAVSKLWPSGSSQNNPAPKDDQSCHDHEDYEYQEIEDQELVESDNYDLDAESEF